MHPRSRSRKVLSLAFSFAAVGVLAAATLREGSRDGMSGPLPSPGLFASMTQGHICTLRPALAANSCVGSKDCFTGSNGAENCQLPPGWNGPTNNTCVCPTPPPY